MTRQSLFSVLLFCLLVGCSISPVTPLNEQTKNISTEKPQPTDNTLPLKKDEFPAKAELRYANAFKVEYFDNYKVVTVIQPWRDANRTFTYILVQRGTMHPQDIGDAQVIEIPIQKIASLSTTHLPYLDEINVLDTLTAIGNSQYVNTPGVVKGIESGSIRKVGNGPEVNIEILLEINPEVVTTTALGNSKKDDYQMLMKKGLKVVVVSDFMEETPLGRAEWVKFMSLFYNQEALAETVFSGIEERYEKMRTRAAAITERPTVIMGFEINGIWNMPGGKSYQATYIQDAGGNYLWADDGTTGRIPLSFEAVLEKGADADFWFNQSVSWITDKDVLAADPRYLNFIAFKESRAFNNNARLNITGGNDYNESGHANPDLILADLVSILHPEILSDHKLIYYRPLAQGGN